MEGLDQIIDSAGLELTEAQRIALDQQIYGTAYLKVGREITELGPARAHITVKRVDPELLGHAQRPTLVHMDEISLVPCKACRDGGIRHADNCPFIER